MSWWNSPSFCTSSTTPPSSCMTNCRRAPGQADRIGTRRFLQIGSDGGGHVVFCRKFRTTPIENGRSICNCTGITTWHIANENESIRPRPRFYDEQVFMLVITALASLAVVILNLALKSILVTLAAFERPLTVSGLECAVALKVFFAQFLNTTVIVYILNWNFWIFEPIFGGDYNESGYKWYATVGMAICTTMLINVVSPHLVMVVVAKIMKCKVRC